MPEEKELLDFSNLLIAFKFPFLFSCSYKNWKGETSIRQLEAKEVWFGTTQWHTEPGLLLRAYDLVKQETRDFKLSDFDFKTLQLLESV